MLKKILTIGLSVGVATSLMATSNVQMGAMKTKLKKMAGKPGIFLQGKEDFPKDYFLVSKNLPFLVGLTLYHPQSSTLGLSKEQINRIKLIKKQTVPTVVKIAKDIKMLELKLARNIAIDSNTPQSQYKIVNAISKLRTDLTKEHLQCIYNVKKILTKKQYQKLLKYAIKKEK